MNKWDCEVCGYIYDGNKSPKECPVCKASSHKFHKIKEGILWQDNNKIGVAKNIDEQMTEDLRRNFSKECNEVGMYLAMSVVANKEGYPEVAKEYKKVALEEANHASQFAQLLGDVVDPFTKVNLKNRIKAEYGATQDKLKLAKRAKELGADQVHDRVNEMCRDEARHGRAFLELLNRYFK